MIWKTTLAKKILLAENVKTAFHSEGYFSLGRKTALILFLAIMATFNLAAQTAQGVISGDDCITFDSCPEDQVVCATDVVNGQLGAYVDWTSPVITQTCTANRKFSDVI